MEEPSAVHSNCPLESPAELVRVKEVQARLAEEMGSLSHSFAMAWSDAVIKAVALSLLQYERTKTEN